MSPALTLHGVRYVAQSGVINFAKTGWQLPGYSILKRR